MTAYYNEIEPYAVEWLRNLIAAGHLPAGDVDTRSIVEVQPDDLKGYDECHFFAGIGGWPLALRMAGWTGRSVWTGSCPCQPFSAAGKQRGTSDERHLWPEFFRLIAECRPATVFGEQVASKLGREWLTGVFANLEGVGYAAAGADLCAAGVGAPHIRQRLWWVADADSHRAQRIAGNDGEAPEVSEGEREPEHGAAVSERGGKDCSRGCGDGGGSGLADADESRPSGRAIWQAGEASRKQLSTTRCGEGYGWLGNADDKGSQGRRVLPECADKRSPWASSLDCWLPCADGKARRIEPGIAPLAHGIPARVGKLRAYGNAIVPQVAAAFVMAVADA